MKQQTVLDDNGTESYLNLSMKVPTAVDLIYKVSVFTDKYNHLNEFNEKVNRAFNARQVYIKPNGHDLPMTLESINDESAYNIDDRQFYSQTFSIKVMAYLITKDDYRITHSPKKFSLSSFNIAADGIMTVDEIVNEGVEPQEITYEVTFNGYGGGRGYFTIPRDLSVREIKTTNVYRGSTYKVWVNGTPTRLEGKTLNGGDKIKLKVKSATPNEVCKIEIIGN